MASATAEVDEFVRSALFTWVSYSAEMRVNDIISWVDL